MLVALQENGTYVATLFTPVAAPLCVCVSKIQAKVYTNKGRGCRQRGENLFS